MKRRIKMLIIDDIEKKRQEIKSQLSRFGRSVDFTFSEAENYEQARDALRGSNYDFVILDLMIPAGKEEPSEAWSRTLLMDILSGELCFPMHIFGLTEHAELMESERRYYDQNLFGLFEFKWSSDDWALAIWNKIKYLISAIENGTAYRLNSYDFDLLLLTARRANEFVPVKKYFFKDDASDVNPLWNDDYSFFGKLQLGADLSLRAALICIGETGLAPAASITTQAIQLLRPRIVVMLGMCAGFESKGMRLLDVIVARETACWQEGKSLDTATGEEFDPRGEVRSWSEGIGTKFRLSHEMLEKEYSSSLADVKETVTYLRLSQLYGDAVSQRLNVKPGLLVSGSSVVASKATREQILTRHARAIGLEMEAFGVYTAAKYAKGARPEYLTIKGVADLADNGKGDEAQALASELSARVLEFFLKSTKFDFLETA